MKVNEEEAVLINVLKQDFFELEYVNPRIHRLSKVIIFQIVLHAFFFFYLNIEDVPMKEAHAGLLSDPAHLLPLYKKE